MNHPNKKYKRPKQKILSTTKPGSSRQRPNTDFRDDSPEAVCPLAAKDSEWVDILQTPDTNSGQSSAHMSDEEEVLQLVNVECEESPQMKPLAIMFPGLLEKDPNTLQGMLNKAMSTTVVTRYLVDLGQKANFTFMKKADRLIPKDKQWLDSLTENSNSITSIATDFFNGSISSDYEADNEINPGNDDLHPSRTNRLKNPVPEADLEINSDGLVTYMQGIISELIILMNEVSMDKGFVD